VSAEASAASADCVEAAYTGFGASSPLLAGDLVLGGTQCPPAQYGEFDTLQLAAQPRPFGG